MSTLFSNHSYSSPVSKHKKLPIYVTDEFIFYRCVNVKDWVYGKTISELHTGNLRSNENNDGRYSKLFPNEKISYWADTKSTALAEIKNHNGNKNYLTFMSYDDSTSTYPILKNNEPLKIIDGKDLEFHKILLQIQKNNKLTIEQSKIIEKIKDENPDCLAYKSEVKKDGVNFLFFEKGFKKLSLKKVQLYLGERTSKNTKTISCANSSDYSPIIENYGKCFKPLVKLQMDNTYKDTEEYKERINNYKNALKIYGYNTDKS